VNCVCLQSQLSGIPQGQECELKWAVAFKDFHGWQGLNALSQDTGAQELSLGPGSVSKSRTVGTKMYFKMKRTRNRSSNCFQEQLECMCYRAKHMDRVCLASFRS
jgi:hypothetical protein